MSNEMQLSEGAKAALLAAPSWNQGALVSNLTFGVKAELHQEGMISLGDGLTRKGSILAQKLKQARERELFGE
jgi:hypothetical protein